MIVSIFVNSFKKNFYFTLQYCIGFPYINMNPPRVHMSSQSWTPSHLLPYTISLGHPSAPAPSILYPALNLDWWFISYMILYMFQCHSPKSSPTPTSHRVQTIFLNSIYMRKYTVLVFFFLAYFTLYNWLQFHPSHQNWFHIWFPKFSFASYGKFGTRFSNLYCQTCPIPLDH